METIFTPWLSLGGGMLIGVAAVLFLWGCGRIMGISGMLSRLLPPWSADVDRMPRLAFVFGMLLVPLVGLVGSVLQQVEPLNSNMLLLVIAGLCAGYGTVRGSGCTSGHGVCGISRLSQRSMVATAVFMSTAAASVFFARHIMGWI